MGRSTGAPRSPPDARIHWRRTATRVVAECAGVRSKACRSPLLRTLLRSARSSGGLKLFSRLEMGSPSDAGAGPVAVTFGGEGRNRHLWPASDRSMSLRNLPQCCPDSSYPLHPMARQPSSAGSGGAVRPWPHYSPRLGPLVIRGRVLARPSCARSNTFATLRALHRSPCGVVLPLEFSLLAISVSDVAPSRTRSATAHRPAVTLSNAKGKREAPSLSANVMCPHSSQTNRSEPAMCVSAISWAQRKCLCAVTFPHPKHSFTIMRLATLPVGP
jgi:hypothetical protein